MGYCRDSFYRYKELYDTGSEIALQEISSQKAILKNRAAPEIEEAAATMAIEYLAYGQVIVSNELKKRRTFVSPGEVRRVWLWHVLESFKKGIKGFGSQSRSGKDLS